MDSPAWGFHVNYFAFQMCGMSGMLRDYVILILELLNLVSQWTTSFMEPLLAHDHYPNWQPDPWVGCPSQTDRSIKLSGVAPRGKIKSPLLSPWKVVLWINRSFWWSSYRSFWSCLPFVQRRALVDEKVMSTPDVDIHKSAPLFAEAT